MGIGFVFSATLKDQAKEIETLKTLAEKAGSPFEEYPYQPDHLVYRLEFCPGGEMFLVFKDGAVSCDCQTNIAGPGFHAGAVEFLESFAKQNELEHVFDDETEYADDKDFDRIREEHFNRWLAKLFSMLAERIRAEEATDWMISWPLDEYQPKSVPGTVVTPMGRFVPDDVLKRIESDGIAAVAADYYVWPNKDKDALFYRNSALFRLWSDCYFMPSSRSEQDKEINGRIVADLEQAAKLDKTVPFPKKTYSELCQLNGTKPVSVDSNPVYTLFDPIGYRRDEIRQVLGNLWIPLPGNFLQDEEEQDDAPCQTFSDCLDENWHTIHLSALGVEETPTEFDPELFAGAVEEAERIEGKELDIKAAYFGIGTDPEDDEPYHTVRAEIHSPKQFSIMTIVFQNESEKAWAFAFLKDILVRETSEE